MSWKTHPWNIGDRIRVRIAVSEKQADGTYKLVKDQNGDQLYAHPFATVSEVGSGVTPSDILVVGTYATGNSTKPFGWSDFENEEVALFLFTALTPEEIGQGRVMSNGQ